MCDWYLAWSQSCVQSSPLSILEHFIIPALPKPSLAILNLFSPTPSPFSLQFSWVIQLCLTLCDPMNHTRLPCPSFRTISLSLLKAISIKSMMPSNHLIVFRPLLLLPSVFPSIRVFSNESVLCIRWPKYWSFLGNH